MSGSMGKLYETPVKSIRKYCLELCSLTPKEVRLCTCLDCPLYFYRMGKRPSKKTIENVVKHKAKNPELAKEK